MENNIWYRNFELAKQYYKQNGDLLIPSNYETDGKIKLGMWISHQRSDYKNSKMSKEKLQYLIMIACHLTVHARKLKLDLDRSNGWIYAFIRLANAV